jgi:L-alanine-DL-glutamate epimerase-like enolase superfamily enzyme
MKLQEITLRRVRLPLIQPYVLSYRTFNEFEPIIVEVRDGDGRIGWGEGHISPGSSSETREGGWTFCLRYADAILGKETEDAKAIVAADMHRSRVAATALLTAVEMLEDHSLLNIADEVRLPLLTAFNSSAPNEIETEVEQRLEQGFRTFKLKVGKDADADLARVRAIQRAIDGRASMRLDANRAYAEPDARRFAAALDPSGIELFEQPCRADDWEANASVAAVSPVPIMLDEPICGLEDIERAADIPNIGFCKLKLKRFGSLDALKQALEKVRECDMDPVLGDGLSSEIGCWMEACVASRIIRNAGEFNGFLKPKTRLFTEPLEFVTGELVLAAGFTPKINTDVLVTHEIAYERFITARTA